MQPSWKIGEFGVEPYVGRMVGCSAEGMLRSRAALSLLSVLRPQAGGVKQSGTSEERNDEERPGRAPGQGRGLPRGRGTTKS